MAKVPVHEFRRIVFPLETAVDAILELDREQGGQLALGTLEGAHVATEPEPGLVIRVIRRGYTEPEERRYGLTAIAAAFISYCAKARIPLPRQGTRRMALIEQGFAFTIEGTFEVVRRHGALPAERAADPAQRVEVPAAADP